MPAGATRQSVRRRKPPYSLPASAVFFLFFMGSLRPRAAWCRCRMVGCRPIGLSSLPPSPRLRRTSHFVSVPGLPRRSKAEAGGISLCNSNTRGEKGVHGGNVRFPPHAPGAMHIHLSVPVRICPYPSVVQRPSILMNLGRAVSKSTPYQL